MKDGLITNVGRKKYLDAKQIYYNCGYQYEEYKGIEKNQDRNLILSSSRAPENEKSL